MKKNTFKIIVMSLLILPLIAIALPAEAISPPGWNVTGNYVVAFNYLGTDYAHDMSLTQDIVGNLTGNGGNPAGGPHVYTWVLTSGSVAGNSIDFWANYTATPDAVTPQTTMHVTGTIAPNGVMSGAWSDNYQGGARSGTWSATSGVATIIPPTVPTIISPVSNICVTSANQQLIDWTDSIGVAPIKYQYQAYSDSGYTALIYDSGMTLLTSQIPTPGTPNGVYYIRVRAQDGNSNVSAWSNDSSNPYKITVSDTFTWSSFLSPLNISEKNYKRGSTIPIKLQILDACGNGVNMGLPALTINGGAVIVDPFRYDALAGQYISNWSTKVPTLLLAGTYNIAIGSLPGVTGALPTTTVNLVR